MSNTNQISGSNTNLKGTKAYISNTSNSTKFDKLNNFLFQCYFYVCTNPAQFDMNIVKINFIMIYLTRVAQNWFEMGLNQKDQNILQNQLSN